MHLSLSVSWFEYFLVNLSRWSICWNKNGRKMKQESDQLLRERTQIVLLWIFAPLERVSLKANTNNSAYVQSRALQSPDARIVQEMGLCFASTCKYRNSTSTHQLGCGQVQECADPQKCSRNLEEKTIFRDLQDEILRILLKQNTALLSYVRVCVSVLVTGVTSQVFSIIWLFRPWKP